MERVTVVIAMVAAGGAYFAANAVTAFAVRAGVKARHPRSEGILSAFAAGLLTILLSTGRS